MAITRAIGLYFAVLGAALGFFTLRLRELSLGDAPFALWLPFVRPLLSAAFEASLLVGVPSAWLLLFFELRRRSPRPRSGPILAAAALALVTFSAGGALVTDVGSRAPGQLAQELIDRARDACDTSPDRSVAVPLVRVSWVCPAGGPWVLSGKAAELGGAVFTATALRVSEDLRRFELENLELRLPPRAGRIGARVVAANAKIIGLPPWGRPRNFPLSARLVASLLGVIAVVLACLKVLSKQDRPGLAVFLGGLGGISMFAVQQVLDRQHAGVLGYFLGVPAGVSVVAVLWLLMWGQSLVRQRVRRARGSPGPPS